MAAHLKKHSFTGSTDHDFTGLVSGEALSYDGTGITSVNQSSLSGVNFVTTDLVSTANRTHLFNNNLIINGSGTKFFESLSTGVDASSIYLQSDKVTISAKDLTGSDSAVVEIGKTGMNFVTNGTPMKLSGLTGYNGSILKVNSIGSWEFDAGIVSTGTSIVISASTLVNIKGGSLVADMNTQINGDLVVSQVISGQTVHANEFFSMAPYVGANPASPSDNDVWFHSGATGSITINYKVGGSSYSVELA